MRISDWSSDVCSSDLPLGIVVGRDTPAFPPRSLAVTVIAPNQAGGSTLAGNKMSYNDDMITGWLGVGTQIDGLGHLGIDNVFYNGHRAERSEERRVGKECVRTGSSRGSPDH